MQLVLGQSEAVQPLSGRAALRQLLSLHFSLSSAGSRDRAAMESYIHARFANRHTARIAHFLPNLIALGVDGRYCGAVGLSPAALGPLFAETYLDEPVERAISRATALDVAREEILEIGNLVSTWKGSSLLLFVFLSEVITQLGHRWVLFTATLEVESLLARLGYRPIVLAEADPRRLPDQGASWGGYYRHHPRVMFGEVQPGVTAARKSLVYRTVARAISGQVDRIVEQLRQRDRIGA